MTSVRTKDTAPELAIRRALHGAGYRFRIHRDDLPGRPDIVLPKWNAVIFVHGCFWHRHPGCGRATTPGTRRRFWSNKFALNVERDRRVRKALLATGWRVAICWECAIGNAPTLERLVDRLATWIEGTETTLELGADDLRGAQP